jgi:hypothetical protein
MKGDELQLTGTGIKVAYWMGQCRHGSISLISILYDVFCKH